MVLVNRPPWGKPGNDERALLCPQAAAWLAALKHAREKVFIQTPTFSAAPVVDGVLSAVRRGIEVTLYVDVGFNDGGEALPLQGGTNEEVVRGMYAKLEEHERERLKYYWFTGACKLSCTTGIPYVLIIGVVARDQGKPINAHLQQRNCHVRLLFAASRLIH